MKFLIITDVGYSRVVEAEDFEDALWQACNNHTKWDGVQAIVRIPEEGE